jgi:hypothetical protein
VGNWNRFNQKIQQTGKQWTELVNSTTSKDQLDNLVTEIWDKLKEISKRCFPPFKPKTKFVQWWLPKLNTLRKQVNALKRRVKRRKNSDLKEITNTRFKALKNIYKAELLRAKIECWKKICMGSNKNTPWKMYKTCKAGFGRKPVPTTLTLLDRSVTTSAEETAEALLLKFFPDDITALDTVQQRNTRAHILELKPPDSLTELKFSKHEVDKVIRNLDVKKCPGPDGIDGIIVKRLHKCLPTFWLFLFNKCLLLGCFPKIWKEARVIAIPKSDKTKLHSVQGYHGISLLSIPGKCLEKLVIERLNYYLESTAQLSPQQYGFTAGRSMVDAIKTVTEFVCHSRNLGLKYSLLALDTAGAFDNAWHPGILAQLWKLKCPPKYTA